MENKYKVKIDLQSKETIMTPAQYRIGDTNSAKMEVTLTYAGEIVDLTGQDITWNFEKSDHTNCSQNMSNGVSIVDPINGVFQIIFMSQTLACAGIVRTTITFTKDGIISNTIMFAFTVNGTVNGGDLSINYITAIEQKIAQIQNDYDIIESAYKADLALNVADANMEMIAARKGEIDLPTKIGKMDTAIAGKSTVTTSTTNGKIKVNNIDVSVYNDTSIVNSMASMATQKTDKTYTDSQDNLKRDKATPLLLVDLDQEVKTAMTGGSVAVVGVNSVATTNVIDKAITRVKRTPNGELAILYTANLDVINFDFVNKKVIFPMPYSLLFRSGVISLSAMNIDVSAFPYGYTLVLETANANAITPKTSANILETDVFLANGNPMQQKVVMLGLYKVNGLFPQPISESPREPYPNYTYQYIANNKLYAPWTGMAKTAKYSAVDIGSVPSGMKAKVIFTTGDIGGVAALICNPNGMTAISNITQGSLHMLFLSYNVQITLFINNVMIGLATYVYPTPCLLDNFTEYPIGWSVSGNTITVNCPDGTTTTVTDSRIPTVMGRYCTFEHFWQGSNNISRPIFTYFEIDVAGSAVLTDNFNRAEGLIGVATTGQSYTQI